MQFTVRRSQFTADCWPHWGASCGVHQGDPLPHCLCKKAVYFSSNCTAEPAVNTGKQSTSLQIRACQSLASESNKASRKSPVASCCRLQRSPEALPVAPIPTFHHALFGGNSTQGLRRFLVTSRPCRLHRVPVVSCQRSRRLPRVPAAGEWRVRGRAGRFRGRR